MATKIKLMRLGKIRSPHYRIVVADARTKRDGKIIEAIGKYRPKEDPSYIEVDSERARYWLSVGAQPTEAVLAILKLTGDWQTSKGQPTESVVKYAEPKPDKKARYDEVVGEVLDRRAKDDAVKAEKKAEKKAKKAKSDTADSAAAGEQSAEKKKSDKKSEKKTAEAPKADATASSGSES